MNRREFIVGGAGAVAAAVLIRPETASATESALRGIFDVKDHGAVGDGSTDDTLAIQAALDAARDANGGVVWFPAGTYLTTTLTLYGAVTMQGTGWQSTLRLKPGTNASVITTRTTQANYYGVIRDLAIDGNKGSQSGTSSGIYLWGANNFLIANVRVRNCLSKGIHVTGNASYNSVLTWVAGCYVDSCGDAGIDLKDYSFDAKVTDTDIGLCNIGMRPSGSGFYSGVSIWQSLTVGVRIYWQANMHWVNCRVEYSKQHGWLIEGCTDSTFTNCRAYENNQVSGAYDGFRLTGSSNHDTTRCTFVGCHSGRTKPSERDKQVWGFSDASSQYVWQNVISSCVAAGNQNVAGFNIGANNVITGNIAS